MKGVATVTPLFFKAFKLNIINYPARSFTISGIYLFFS